MGSVEFDACSPVRIMRSLIWPLGIYGRKRIVRSITMGIGGSGLYIVGTKEFIRVDGNRSSLKKQIEILGKTERMFFSIIEPMGGQP